MEKKIKKIPFLVVSSSPYMRGILKFVLETLVHTEVVELESEEKALSFLKSVEAVPSMIVYDYTPNAYLIEDFLIHLKETSKKVKIIVLVDEVREEAKEMIKNMAQMTLMNEGDLPGKLIDEAKKIFDNSSYENQSEHCRIDINFLTILDGINKNLFIRIGDERYIKIYNEDDNTSILDLKKYKEKGISHLYLQRTTALWVIEQIQKQISIFLKASNFRFILRGASDTPEKRYEQKILRIDDEVHIDAEFKESITKAIERIRAIVEKEGKVENLLRIIKQKHDTYALYTRKINLTSLMACALAKELEWISKTTMDKLVYAAVLSDITLAVKPELLMIANKSEFERTKHSFSEEDQKIFLSHPRDGANLIKRYFSAAPPDTDSLAYQHHELPDGSGFPQGLRAERISPLGALFIVANDFSYYFLRDDEPTLEDFLLKAHSKYDFVNFRKVVKALEAMKRRPVS